MNFNQYHCQPNKENYKSTQYPNQYYNQQPNISSAVNSYNQSLPATEPRDPKLASANTKRVLAAVLAAKGQQTQPGGPTYAYMVAMLILSLVLFQGLPLVATE